MIKELAWVNGGQWLYVISFNLGTAEKTKRNQINMKI